MFTFKLNYSHNEKKQKKGIKNIFIKNMSSINYKKNDNEEMCKLSDKIPGKIYSIIPLNLFQTWHSLDLPPKMRENIELLKKQNPEFQYHLFDDAMCREFIFTNFDRTILFAYDKLKPGAYKADLWRYCVLYKKGGIYLDIKYSCVNQFKLLELTDKEYYVRDRSYSINNIIPSSCGIYQALLVCLPKNKIILNVIHKIVENCINNNYNYNDLDVTGPFTLASFFNQNIEIDKFVLSFNGETIQYENKDILKSYNEYRQEQLSNQITKYYKTMWLENDIYNYIDLQSTNITKLTSVRNIRIDNNLVTFYSGTPTIVEYLDTYIVNVRWINYRYNNDGTLVSKPDKWISLNSRFLIDKKFNKISDELFLKEDFTNKDDWWGLGLEDIRIYNYKNNYYYISTQFDSKRQLTSISSNIYHYNSDSYDLSRNIILPNFYDLVNDRRTEKNWSFVTYKDTLCVVYNWYPLQIGKIDYETINLSIIDIKYDIPDYFKDSRGSTPGYSTKDEIWFVLHKARTKEKYNYQHFFAVFDLDMNLIRYSELFKLGKSRIEFCIGLIVKDTEIILSYSLQDTESFIATYDIHCLNYELIWYVYD